MKKLNNVLWGIVLVAVGVVWALDLLGIMDVNIFFKGWWTMFIIIPCTIGLFTEREKTGNLVGIAIGVCLLLCSWDILSFKLLGKLLVPALIVIFGLKLVFNGLFGNKGKEMLKKMKQEGKSFKTGSAAFSGCDLNYDNQVFEGAELTAVFGGISCDLRKAIINQDCAISVTAVFGGIDILVPPGINVKVNANGIFGGTSNKTATYQNAPTIYISGNCIFGGVEIQ